MTAEDQPQSYDAQQQQLHNGLARHANYSIFARKCIGTGMDFSRMYSMLA